MTGSETCVVLIGVGHYANLPAAQSLHAPVNDVQAWSQLLHHKLHVRPGLIKRLESPMPGQSAGEGALPATAGVAVEAVHAMRDWLFEHPGGTGVLVFSGHGATDAAATTAEGARLRLCMQDFDLDNPRATSLGVGEIHRILGPVADRVTLITDCCYADYTVEPADEDDPHVKPITARMLLGSGEFSPAYSVKVDGHWKGLFTHALITSLELWLTQTEGKVHYVMGSYQDVLFRARALIATMGFQDQQPVCAGPTYVAALPFNYPATSAPRSALSLVPNLLRRKREVSSESDIPYLFTLSAGQEDYFAWCTAGATSSQSVRVRFQDGNSMLVDAPNLVMLEGIQFLPIASAPPSLTLTGKPATLVSGGAYEIDLDFQVCAVSDSCSQDSDVSWEPGSWGPAPGSTSCLVYGPFPMSIGDGTAGSVVDVYIQFNFSILPVVGIASVQYYAALTAGAGFPHGVIDLTSGIGTAATLQPGPPAGHWYLLGTDDWNRA